MKIFYKNSIIAISLFAALSAHALDTRIQGLAVSVMPDFPHPGENFRVEAKSYVFDSLRGNFSWSLNGKTISSGVGLTSIDLTAGKAGSVMKIDLAASAPGGQTYSKSITLNIADVDVFANPLTYVPLFYRGAPLASVSSLIEVYAVPQLYSNGARISDQNIVYEWFLNDGKSAGDSGQGKNRFVFFVPDSGGFMSTVSVKASNISGSVVFKKTIVISPVEPQIFFYKTDPLLGRAGASRVSFDMKGGATMSIIAEPYFFGLSSLNNATLVWSANGKEFQQPAGKNPLLLEISAPQNSIALTTFSLSMRDKKTIHQNAFGLFNITASQ